MLTKVIQQAAAGAAAGTRTATAGYPPALTVVPAHAGIEHVTELPPDPERLRAILRYLDQQITDNETVGIYLQLQRDAVRQALGHTEPAHAEPEPAPEPKPRRRGRLPKGATGLPTFAPPRHAGSSGFCVEEQPRAVGPEPLRVHVDDCTSMVDGQPISVQDARQMLLDPSAACQFCRPDAELGVDGD